MKKFISALILALLNAAILHADIVDSTGFELGTGEPSQGNFSNHGGQILVQSGTVKTGGYALEIDTTGFGTDVAWWRLGGIATQGYKTGASEADAWIPISFLYTVKAAANDEEIFETQDFGGGNPKIEIRLNSSGNLTAYDSTGTLIGTGTTVLAASTWYDIEILSGTGAAANWGVKINGILEPNLSGTADLQTNNNATFALGKVHDRNGNAIHYFFDNFVISNTGYLGRARVLNQLPIGTGDIHDWLSGTNASDWNEEKETPADNDTTYVACLAVLATQVDLVTLQSTSTLGISGSVKAVKAIADRREVISVSSSSQVRLRSSGVDLDTVAEDANTSYEYREIIANTDPNTAAAWTLAGVSAAQVGVVENNSAAMRSTLVRTAVVFVEADSSHLLASTGVGR